MAEETGKFSWWKNRSKLEQYLIVGVVIGSIILIIALGIYFSIGRTEICTSQGCIRTAMEIIENIDNKTNPCEDFYKFACGNFIKTATTDDNKEESIQRRAQLEVDKQIKSLLEQPVEHLEMKHMGYAKKFYKACMDENAREKQGFGRIRNIFYDIGQWPLISSSWNQNNFNWIEAIHKLRRHGINFEMFFRISVEKDTSGSDTYVIVLKKPSFTKTDVEKIPIRYMINLAVEFGADKKRVHTEQREVLELLKEIAEVIGDIKDGYYEHSEKMTISELETKYPGVNWWDYINGVLNLNYNITGNDRVYVTDPDYIKNVTTILRNKNKRKLANFICWFTLQYVIQYLPMFFQDKFHHLAQGPNRQLWESCLEETRKRFPLTLSAAFAELSYDLENRVKIMEMIRNIKEQFKYALQNLDWMDEATKRKARKRISSSTEDILSHEEIKDALSVENVFEHIAIDESKYFETVLRIDAVKLNLKYGKLNQPARNTLWNCSKFPTQFDMVYSSQENAFKIPTGLTQGLYFAMDRPNYINYGILGNVLAREISHLFTRAEYRDQEGRTGDWWSPHTLLNYGERIKCVRREYSKAFYVSDYDEDRKIYSNSDEDVADFAGIKISYESYIKWAYYSKEEPRLPGLDYTPEQLFWISAASRLCTKRASHNATYYSEKTQESFEKIRVNAAFRNSAYFHKDFGCSRESYMNPENKCVIW